MKTIILFSRCELVDLYGAISSYLIKNFNVIHLAYSKNEARTLKQKYNIETPYVFRDLVSKIIDDIEVDNTIIKEIDYFIIKETNGRFCLNSAIQSDRYFSNLNYHEVLLLVQAYYIFWNRFLKDLNAKIIIHEPPSLFFNHIASLVCKREHIYYCSQIMVKSEKEYSFIYVSGDNADAIEYNSKYQKIDEIELTREKSRIDKYLDEFRSSEKVFLSDIIKQRICYICIILSVIRNFINKMVKFKKYDKLKDYIDYWGLRAGSSYIRLRNIINYALKLKYDTFDPELNYYYYSMHLEPEAVVLYWGDGLYKGQIKLIENIAGQLPPNTYLYVKDHPHYIGYRAVKDYLALKKIPNIRLINPKISGRILIKNSIGIITINGTAGFEGILMNKLTYLFGNAFYSISKRAIKINHIKDLREEIYKNHEDVLNDDNELYKTVLALLDSTHEGVIDYFSNRIGKYKINYENNIRVIADSVISLMENHIK